MKNPIGFVRDFVALLGSRGIGEALVAIVGLLIARNLAAEDYARYVLAMTVVGIAGVVVHFGMNAILTREVSREPYRAATLLTQATLFRLTCAIIVYPTAYVIVRTWPAAGDSHLYLIAGLAFFPMALRETLIALLNGLDRIRVSATIMLVTQVLNACLVVGALLFFGRPGPILAAGVVAGLAGGLFATWVSFGGLRPERSISPTVWWELATMGSPLMLMALAATGFQALDVYVVSYYLGQAAVGQYGAALRMLGFMLLLPTLWSVVALPRFSRAVGDPAATSRLLTQALLTIGLLAVLLAGLLAVLARPLTIWILGQRYAQAAAVLSVLTGAFAVASLSAPLTTLLTAYNQQAKVAAVVAAGGVLGLAANVLIAGRMGVTGVAAVRVGAMLFVLVACSWLALGAIQPAGST